MKSFTNEPTNISFKKIVLNAAVTLTADSSGDTWTLVLPPDSGTIAQVLTTDGNGTTSWESATTGTLTSVALDVPAFLTISDSPITGAGGTMTIGLNTNTALPVTSGGTGVIGSSTGSDGVVLSNTPTIANLSTTGTSNIGNNTGDININGPTGIQNGNLSLNSNDIILAQSLSFPNMERARKIILFQNFENDFEFSGFGIGAFKLDYQVGSASSDHVFSSAIDAFSSKELLRIKGNGVVDIPGSLTIGTALPVTSGGTGVLESTGNGKVVLSNAPILNAPSLTSPQISGNNSFTIITTQALEPWTLNLPTDIGSSGQVLTTSGFSNGITSWQTITTGTITSVGLTVPEHLSISNSPLGGAGGTMAITYSETPLAPANGGTGSDSASTGSGGVVLSNGPELTSAALTTPTIVASAFSHTLLDSEAFTSYTFKFPAGNGGENNIFRADGDGTNSWMGIDITLQIEDDTLKVSDQLVGFISDNTDRSKENEEGVEDLVEGQNILYNVPFGTQTIANAASTGTTLLMAYSLPAIPIPVQPALTVQAITNTTFSGAIGGNTTNIGNNTTALLLKLSTVGINVPTFLSASSAVTTIDGTGGDIDITLNSGTPLPVNSGGTGVLEATGTGKTVLSTDSELFTPVIFEPKIQGVLTGNTILKSLATVDWTLSLPVDGGTNLQLLRTNGSGTTTWAPVSGTGDVVLKSAPSIDAPLLTDPKIAGTFDTTIDTQATSNWTLSLPVDGGTSGQVLTTGGAGVTTWSPVSTGTVTSVQTSVPAFLEVLSDPVEDSGTIAITYSGTALPYQNGGTGETTEPTGTGTIVKETAPIISTLTTTGTTLMNELTLTTDLAITHGGTGSSTATGTGSVVLETLPTISGLTTTGTTLMNELTLTTDLAITHGGTGTSTATGSGSVVLATAPTISGLTTTGTTLMNTLTLTNRLATSQGGTGSISASTGTGGVVLSNAPTFTGTTTLAGVSCGAIGCGNIVGLSAGFSSLTLTTDLAIAHGGTGSSTATGTGSVVLETLPTISTLTATGTTNLSYTQINGNNNLEFGFGETKETNAGKIGYGTFGSNALNIIGAGTASGDRVVKIFDKLQFSNTVHSRIITLFEDIDNDHQYSGFGINAFTLRYQVGGSSSDHVFYSAINDSSSLELLRVKGNGVVDIPGSLTIGTALPVTSGGTGTSTATGTGDLVLSENPYIRGDGVKTFVAQFQDDPGVNTSIAITAGEADEAAIFFGTNNADSPTGAHKNAIISKGINSFSRADLHFCLNNEGNNTASATVANSRMMIEPDGNVGIGTVSPASKLDVNGTITATDLILANALPVTQGGTGTTIATGSGSMVLATAPTISGTILAGVTGFTGNMFMNDNHVFLRNNSTHGLKWESDVDGPNLFGNAGGRLSSGGTGRAWWGPDGLSTNDIDYFKYTTGSWTPVWGGSGTATMTATGQYIKMGRQVTVFVEIDVTSLSSGVNLQPVFFTGFPLTNTLSPWQRCNISEGVVVTRVAPFNFTIKNGSSDMHLYDATGAVVTVSITGTFIGHFYSVFSFIS